LVRDALATRFVAAAGGDASARAALDELSRWRDGAAPGPALRAVRAGDDALLFDDDGLSEPFRAQEAFARDRALRLRAALGWIDAARATGDPVACACAAWDAGLFFEVHELLEPVWLAERGPRRGALQGIIMAGAALHHLTQGNLAGARGLLRDSVRHLAGSSAELGLDLPRFARDLARLADAIDAGAVRGAADLARVPSLRA
jgi:hypothetical protein